MIQDMDLKNKWNSIKRSEQKRAVFQKDLYEGRFGVVVEHSVQRVENSLLVDYLIRSEKAKELIMVSGP